MDAPLPPDVVKQIVTGFSHLLANKYYVLASTVMLCYDHLITFDREVEFVWNKRKSMPSYLFIAFRYLTPIVSLINLVALNDPGWVGAACDHWIWLPVAIGPIISATTGIILILRVYAIYQQSFWVLLVIVPVYLAQLGVMGWSIPAGAPAPLPPGFVGCVPSEKAGSGQRLSALYIAALVFDASIFILTFGRALYLRLTNSTIPLVTVIVRDGTLYFMVIFVVNTVNVILLSVATPDLSAINAPFASMITAILVARLMLNLREAGARAVVLSKGSRARSLHLQSGGLGSWRVADRSGTGTTTDTYNLPSSEGDSDDHPSHLRSGVGHAPGKGAVHSFIGIDEFDFALGEDSVGSDSRVESEQTGSSGSGDEELGKVHETHEMNAR